MSRSIFLTSHLQDAVLFPVNDKPRLSFLLDDFSLFSYLTHPTAVQKQDREKRRPFIYDRNALIYCFISSILNTTLLPSSFMFYQ